MPPTADKAIQFTVNPSGGGTAESDWIARSTAAGVLYATDFRDTADFFELRTAPFTPRNRGVWENQAPFNQAFRDTSEGITGGACLRINRRSDGSANQASWICQFNPAWTQASQGMGSTRFWVQVRCKFPPGRAAPQPSIANHKIIIFSNYNCGAPYNSHSDLGSIVFDSYGFGAASGDPGTNWHPSMYDSQNEGIYDATTVPGNFRLQNVLDNGAALPQNDRYCLWNAGVHSPGCWRFDINAWMTFDFEFRVQTYGGETGNEVKMWASRFGSSTRTQLYGPSGSIYVENAGILGPYTGGMNGLWLTAYETGFGQGGTDTYQLYDQLIISTQPIALPAAGA